MDLAICNEYMIDDFTEMLIDEAEEFRPTKYGVKKSTKSDHNTIVMKLKVNKLASQKPLPYFNIRCESGQAKFEEELQKVYLDDLFNDELKINDDHQKLMKLWDDVISRSFKKVRRSNNDSKGIDHGIKQLMKEGRNIKVSVSDGKEKKEKLEEI